MKRKKKFRFDLPSDFLHGSGSKKAGIEKEPDIPYELSVNKESRIRYLKLEESFRKGMTICDCCGEKTQRSNSIECWKGNVVAYVVCFVCLLNKKNKITIEASPSGIHITVSESDNELLEETIRTASDFLPSQHSPISK